MENSEIRIHCSSLPAYSDCPRRAAARVIRDIIEGAGYRLRETRQGVGAAFGSGVHASARGIMQKKIDGGQMSDDDALEIAVAEYRSRIKNGVIFDSATQRNNDAEKQIAMSLRAFRAQVEPQIQPASAETPRRARVAEGVVLVGTSDVEDVRCYLDDYKTGSHLRMYHAQLGGYALLRESHRGVIKRLRKHVIPRVSLRKPYPGTRTIEYDIDISKKAAWSIIQHIQRDVRNFITTGDPEVFLCNPMSMMCSEKYCVCYGTEFCELTKGVSQ